MSDSVTCGKCDAIEQEQIQVRSLRSQLFAAGQLTDEKRKDLIIKELRIIDKLKQHQGIEHGSSGHAQKEEGTEPTSDKAFFVAAYFNSMLARVENLAKLNGSRVDDVSFKDEALILCLVYIDGMASCYYGSNDGENKISFCKALRELSGNPIFAKLHASYLLGPENDKYWDKAKVAKSAVEELAASKQGQLLDEAEVADKIHRVDLPAQVRDKLIENLWRCSIGAICYDVMRNAAVHGLGASPLSFDETLYDGKQGFTLNFSVLHDALKRISEHIARESIAKGEWFGRENYLKQ